MMQKNLADYQPYVSTDDEEQDQIEFSRDSEKWSGVWQDDEVEVKHDPGASDDAMDVDVIEGTTPLVKSSQDRAGQVDGGNGANCFSFS